MRDIAEANDPTVLPRAEDDPLEVFDALEPAFGLHDRERARAAARRGAESAGGGFDILRAQSGDDIASGQASRGQLRRVEPDAHGVFARAPNDRVGDAGYRGQLVAHVEQRIVGDVKGIVGIGGADQMHHHQDVGGDALRHEPEAANLLGQSRLGPVDAVLHRDTR